jgi:hypothetical protein
LIRALWLCNQQCNRSCKQIFLPREACHDCSHALDFDWRGFFRHKRQISVRRADLSQHDAILLYVQKGTGNSLTRDAREEEEKKPIKSNRGGP